MTKADVINTLAGIADGSLLAALRAQKLDVQTYTQGSDDALFNPTDLGGLSLIERELVGLRVAMLNKNDAMLARHRDHLRGLGADHILAALAQRDEPVQVSPRLSAILHFTDRLTKMPRTATPADIESLVSAGLSDRDVVTLGQLIAYLGYQVRLLAGLRALGANGGAK